MALRAAEILVWRQGDGLNVRIRAGVRKGVVAPVGFAAASTTR